MKPCRDYVAGRVRAADKNPGALKKVLDSVTLPGYGAPKLHSCAQRQPDEVAMDRAIATALLERELAAARALGYAALRQRIGSDTVKEVAGPDGKAYQLALLILWDRAAEGPIRLIASIHDGGRRAFKPLTADDLVQPPE